MRRLLWPGSLIALVLAVVIVNGVMIVVASSDAPVERDHAPAPAAWRISLRLDAAATDHAVPGTTARVTVHDEQDRPLDGAHVTVAAARTDGGPERRRADLRPDGPGVYVGRLALDGLENWRCVVTVERDGLRCERSFPPPPAREDSP